MSRSRGGGVVAAVLVGLFCYGYVQAETGDAAPVELSGASCTTVAQRYGLSDEQMGNAATIATVGADLDMGRRAVVVALATAMQESRLRNLDHGDRDSLGLFQQRPSQGWGTAAQVQDPVYAATSFYRTLAQVEGWRDMRVTQAAQAVQISAFPEAYQQWVPQSRDLARALLAGC